MITKRFLLIFMMALWGLPVFAEKVTSSEKTLSKRPDPVIMAGELAHGMIGFPISGLRLYAKKEGKFQPIRYQIDEMTEYGDWILPEGPSPNGEMADKVLSAQDKLVFMADDTGDQVSEKEWFPGYAKGIEIVVEDSATGDKGWCYLLYFSENPPPLSSLSDYVKYDYRTETIQTEFYRKQFIIKDSRHTVFYKDYSVSEKAGGNGKNFVDRIKARINIKMRFGGLSFQINEETLGSNVLAYKRGPVRLIRRSEQYIDLPLSIKGMRLVNDALYYRNVITVPAITIVPFRLDRWVSSFSVSFGTDFHPDIMPSKLVTPGNTEGCILNGKTEENERAINTQDTQWAVITGEFGTFMTRYIFTPELLASGINIKSRMTDDGLSVFPPEFFPGSIGYLQKILEFSNVKKGTYTFFSEYYILPFYQSGDETAYIRYMDEPLMVKVGLVEGQSLVALIPVIGKTHR